MTKSRTITDDEQFIKEIGKKIKEIRKEKGLTQLDLSVKSHCEENSIYRFEKGMSNPTIKTLFHIAQGLEVEVHELLPDQEKEK